jgi:hypothetical protein
VKRESVNRDLAPRPSNHHLNRDHCRNGWVAALHSWRKRNKPTKRPAPTWTTKPTGGYRGGEAPQ